MSYSKKQLQWTLWGFLEEKFLRHICVCVCVCTQRCKTVWASLWTGLFNSHLTILPPLVASYFLSRYFGFRRAPMRLLTSNSMGRSTVFSWIWQKKKSQTPKTIRISLWKLERPCKETSRTYVHTYLAVVFFQQHLKQLYIIYGTEQLICCRYLVIQK